MPAAAPPAATPPLAHARGFADEGGPLASTLATIDQVIPLVCVSAADGLVLAPLDGAGGDVIDLPGQLAPDHEAEGEAPHQQRAGIPGRAPAAVRYYDEARDYQTGVQRADGVRPAGRELMIDLPATLSARGARQLANASASRARWQRETVTWRIGDLDPRILPGAIVRLPDRPGKWLLRSWEWLDRGIALELERLPPAGGTPRPSDPGENLPPADLVIPPSLLAVTEVPPQSALAPAQPLVFAAASAQNAAWRDAALFSVQGSALVDLGTTGGQRAIMGALAAPLAPSTALLFEPRAEALVDLVAPDLDLADTDIAGLAAGANRIMIGGEMVQFLRAHAQGAGRWRLSGLLRGRGGTEPAAALGHPAGTRAILVDERLVALDAHLVPPVAGSQVAAIGTGDADPVVAPLANPGLSRRPPSPVHPRVTTGTDGARTWCWTRRARGCWRWDDGVDVPLVEEREAYMIGFGPAQAPHAAWQSDTPSLRLTAPECTALVAAHGPAALWVVQLGTFDRSPPLLLATLS